MSWLADLAAWMRANRGRALETPLPEHLRPPRDDLGSRPASSLEPLGGDDGGERRSSSNAEAARVRALALLDLAEDFGDVGRQHIADIIKGSWTVEGAAAELAYRRDIHEVFASLAGGAPLARLAIRDRKSVDEARAELGQLRKNIAAEMVEELQVAPEMLKTLSAEIADPAGPDPRAMIAKVVAAQVDQLGDAYAEDKHFNLGARSLVGR